MAEARGVAVPAVSPHFVIHPLSTRSLLIRRISLASISHQRSLYNYQISLSDLAFRLTRPRRMKWVVLEICPLDTFTIALELCYCKNGNVVLRKRGRYNR